MTLVLNKFRTVGSFFALLFFFAFILRPLGEIKVLAISLFMATLLGGLILKHKFQVNIYGSVIFVFLGIGTINFVIDAPWYDFYFPLLVPFFPILLIHYLLTVRKKSIPQSGALIIMAIGFLVTVVYQTILHSGIYPYHLLGEYIFFLAFLVFFGIYMLLTLGFISVWRVVVILILSVFPEIVYVLFLYVQKGMVGLLFAQRFGGAVEFQATQIAAWLDFAFPLVLFVALNEKKTRLKILFYFLTVLYGACFLMTGTRGSFFGLLLLPPYFAFTLKSIGGKLLVLLVSLGAIGIFGQGMVQRTFNPGKGEFMSTSMRQQLLTSGLSCAKDNHYFFGIGFDNFKEEKVRYGFMKMYDTGNHMSSHNEYLEIFLGWGAIGLFGWLYLILGSIIHTARVRVPSEIAYLRPALIFALLFSSLHGLFDSTIACFPFLVFLFSVFACMSFLCKQGKLQKMQELTNFAQR